MKTIIVIFETGFLVVVLVVFPLIETTPSPHTVEPWFSAHPIPTLVVSSTGSYSPSLSRGYQG